MSLATAQPGQSFVKRTCYIDYNGRLMKSKSVLTVNSIYPNKSLELSLQVVVSTVRGKTRINDTFHYIWNPKTNQTITPDPRDANKALLAILEQFLPVKS